MSKSAPHAQQRSPRPGTAPARAVVYVRLSSHDGANDPSTSPARQEASGRAYVEAKSWALAEGVGDGGIVRDLDVSGSSRGLGLGRPGLKAIRAAIAAGAIDVVVFAKLDRLARSVADFHAFARECEASGVALASVAEGLDLTTPAGRFVATILAAFAEMEADTIRERTLAGVDATRRAGRWKGGAPFGMRLVRVTNPAGYILTPDPDTAPIVREMAEAVLAGTPLYRVAQDLNARGVLTQAQRVQAEGRGKRTGALPGWSAKAVRGLLVNPALIGRTVHRGELLRDESGMPRRVWEPVLADDVHRRLVAMLTTKGEAPTGREDRARLLTGGIARCGTCGRPLYATARKRADGEPRPFYVCSAKRNGYDCTGAAIDAAGLEALAERELLDRFGHVEMFRTITEAVDDGRRADIEAALADAARKMTEPGADVMAIAARVQALQAERDALPATAPVVTRRVPLGVTVAEAYRRAETTAERRALLATFIPALRIAPGVRGRHGFDPGRVTVEALPVEVFEMTEGPALTPALFPGLPAQPAQRTATVGPGAG